jgi:hypothetical protein
MTGPRPDVQSLPAVKTTASVPVPTLDQFIAFVKTQNLARQERFFAQFYNIGLGGIDLALLCHQASFPGKNIGTRTLRINGLNRTFAQTVDYMGDSITLEFLVDTDFTPRLIMEQWMEECVSNFEDGHEVGYYENYVRDISLHALAPAGLPGEALFNWSPTQADLGLRDKITTSNRGANVALDKLFGRGKRLIDNKFTKIKSQAFGAVRGIAAPLLELATESEQVIYTITLKEAWPRSINVMPLGYDAVGVHRMNVTFAYHYWESTVNNPKLSGQDMADKATKGLQSKLSKYTDKIKPVDINKLGTDLKDKVKSTGSRLFGRG